MVNSGARWTGVLLGMMVFFVVGSASAQGWEHIATESGVKVTQKDVEGRDLPIFRGETTINANIYELLAVIQDFDRHKEWMHGCYEARLLKKFDDFHRLSYNRTDAPWPVDDRDVVLESKVSLLAAKHTVLINFKGTVSKLKPEVDGVVRMKRLKGYYKLKAISATKTWVQYQVDADPGGSLPDWLVTSTGEEMPINTLTNLRGQVKKVRGQYMDFVKKWDPAHNPDAPKLIP